MTSSVKPMMAARMLLKSWAMPPRERAEGLHLLGLAELLFEQGPFFAL